jgi:hypothetical protein
VRFYAVDSVNRGDSPREVEVIMFHDYLLRSGASGSDSTSPGVRLRLSEILKASDDVESAAAEVERVRDATHSAVALRSAPTGGRTYARTGPQ